jgi:2-methylisocitrate lyase-like PEP mutase family enzyme
MIIQLEHAKILKNLHVKGDPLILFNVWDAGSAIAMQEIGAKVIATGSYSVAASHGYDDGEKLPFDLVLSNFKRIIASVNLPVTIDLESGYGKNSGVLEDIATKVILAGAAGINIEDQIIDGNGLYSIEDQCMRIKTIRKASEQTTIPVFINARTDIFYKNGRDHNVHLKEALYRSGKYAESGANGFFIPGLTDIELIEKLCMLSPIPINVMMQHKMPSLKQLAEVGVARISYGPTPYFLAINSLKAAGLKAFSIS